MPTTLPPIEALGLSKRFSRRALAVDQLSFSIPPGSLVGLVGPNGAGKTTTLRMFLGLAKPTAGSLHVLGFEPHAHAFPLKRLVGYVPDIHHIYPTLRAKDALSFAAAVYPTWDPAESKRLSTQLDLPLKTRVSALSRGQLAKLALVIALAHDPRLLILDEPTGGLDPLVRRTFLDVVADIVRRRPCTVIFSTHILSDVEQLATRLLVMNHGRLLADLTPDQLRARYVKVSFLFDPPPSADTPATIPGALHVTRSLREWVATFPSALADDIPRIAKDLGAQSALTLPVTMDDAFVLLLTPESTPIPA